MLSGTYKSKFLHFHCELKLLSSCCVALLFLSFALSLGGSGKRRDVGARLAWTQVLGPTLSSYVTFLRDPVLVLFRSYELRY